MGEKNGKKSIVVGPLKKILFNLQPTNLILRAVVRGRGFRPDWKNFSMSEPSRDIITNLATEGRL